MQTLDIVRENRGKVVSRSVEEVVERRVMICTGYTNHDPTVNGLGITKSGVKTVEGVTVASDPSLPFGTQISIPELNLILTVQDRGEEIKGNRLDIFMESREDALRFGVRELEVFIRRPQ